MGERTKSVLSKNTETAAGKEAWAGLGRIIQNNHTGKGLFVEHCGSSQEEVKELINKSLESMRKYRPEGYGKISIKTAGIKCKGRPVCTVVTAIYKSESWQEI
ncbi:MAG: hypothetical protein MUP55_00885 [Candidatus Aenigmarchaeota archaeon]|nr:hypothetical protein [Candidatus Aenigmarchaeota archaeon]